MLTDHRVNGLTSTIIGAAMEVHRCLGPGLLESAYAKCLPHELRAGGLAVADGVRHPPQLHKGLELDASYWMDLVVEDEVVLELKSVEHLAWIHKAQLLTYLRLTGREVGLLNNFNVTVLKDKES